LREYKPVGLYAWRLSRPDPVSGLSRYRSVRPGLGAVKL
jgi:hypothetical protein